MAAHVPEVRKGQDEPQLVVRTTLLPHARQSQPHVVVLVLESTMDRNALFERGVCCSMLGQREVIRGVCAPQPARRPSLPKPLRPILPDRLEHPVAPLVEAEKALLDERLQDVEVGIADLLGRLERAAAGKDAQAGEESRCSAGESRS